MRAPIAAAAVLAALATGVLSGCAATPAAEDVVYHANYPAYGSSTELIKKADLVIRGTAVSSRPDEMFPDIPADQDPLTNPQAGLTDEEIKAFRAENGVVTTVATVRVDEVLKGDVAVGDLVEVSQLGGVKDGVKYRDETTTLLEADAKSGYVLFLSTYGAGKPSSLLNPQQAVYTVSAGGTLRPVAAGAPAISTVSELKSDVARVK